MKNKIYFSVILIILMGIMIGYNFLNSSKQEAVYIAKDITGSLTPEEKDYLEGNRTILIGVSDQLAPFIACEKDENGEIAQVEGMIIDFIDVAFSQMNAKGSYVFLPQDELESSIQSGKIHGAVMAYEKEETDRLSFTNPILPTKGMVAVYGQTENNKNVAIKIMDTRKLSSVEQAVSDVVSGKIPLKEGESIGLLGHEPALHYFIDEKDMGENFTFQGEYVYEDNFCIAVNKKETVLYEILNKAIYNLDENQLISQLNGKWFGISYPLENRGVAESIGILFTIILASVMAAFYIFYGSNKTLYEELATRMEQVLESKNELQTTFDGVSYYMIEMDLSGRILNANKAFINFLDAEGHGIVGRELPELLHFDEEKEREVKHMIHQGIVTGLEQKKELAAMKKLYNFRVFPLENSKGKIIKVLVTIQDITKEKMMERQMIQDNKMIAVGQLAAGVAHEIRNPLGLIRNYCYVLKTSEDQKEKAISVIEKAVDRSGRIIDNLLNFSRSSNHQMVKIKLEKHIHEILSLQRNRALKESIQLEINCSPDLEFPVLVECIDMILINLTINAMDAIAGAQTEGKVVIHCIAEDDYVMIKVRDNGEGIPKDNLEEIFNPFFTTKEKRDGNGLGLYIVYNEVKKMNGEIFVESELAKGTEFTVKIPRLEIVSNE